jgi:predicted permease
MLSTTFTILIPVLFVLLLGFFAWRIKAFDAEQVTGINELALDFALPASLLVGIVNIHERSWCKTLPLWWAPACYIKSAGTISGIGRFVDQIFKLGKGEICERSIANRTKRRLY